MSGTTRATFHFDKSRFFQKNAHIVTFEMANFHVHRPADPAIFHLDNFSSYNNFCLS